MRGFVLGGQRCPIHLLCYSVSWELTWASGFVKNTPCWSQIGVIHFIANPGTVGLLVSCWCPICLISGQPTLKMDGVGAAVVIGPWPYPPPPLLRAFNIYSAYQFTRTAEESTTSGAGVRVTSGSWEPVFSMLLCLPPTPRRPHEIASFIMCCPLGTLLKAINSFHCASLWTIKAL